MKKIFLISCLAMTAGAAMAQDTYLNDRMTATDDVIGTARYVGMGGAMGALGADLSTISSNPAAMGLYRKSDAAITFGAIIPNGNGWDNDLVGENKAHASFDQAGFVWSNRMDGAVKFLNVGFNYQKKANYNQAFFADGYLNKLSQMDQMADLANYGYDTDYNLAGAATYYSDPLSTASPYLEQDEMGWYNNYNGENFNYTRHATGSLQSFDFNVSMNVNERFYTGLTIGCDNLRYRSWSDYLEYSTDLAGNKGDYKLYNDRHIDGAGVNVKLGIVVRPIAESSFRIGTTLETPTWYSVKNSTIYSLDNNSQDEAYTEFNIRTPWRGRFSMGSTVGTKFAWDVEYEYANMGKTKMSWDNNDPNSLRGDADKAMNYYTKNQLKGQHTLKAGIEVRPIDAFAFRFGYNIITSHYKNCKNNNSHFDQADINSLAMDYSTSTDYMDLSKVNIITTGIGYKYKKFYVDVAYKFRMQKGKFYAFDDTFAQAGQDYAKANPDIEGRTISPVDVNLNRHQVCMTLGFKF